MRWFLKTPYSPVWELPGICTKTSTWLFAHGNNSCVNMKKANHLQFSIDALFLFTLFLLQDVHRTGCSLFCGVSGKDNQALLKRVLLAYARWNKAVGYCQGFNMLAALILQVMDKSEVDSVKVMIFLIEGVLPESYFANNLRGLSVDMAVFRDLLRIKLPILSRHLDQLQCGDSKDTGKNEFYYWKCDLL